MAQEITTLNGQSAVDITIQHTGSVAAIVDFAIANNISITQNLNAGTVLKTVSPNEKRVVDYYSVKKLTPATSKSERKATRRRGIGNMTVGQDFKVG